MTSAGYVALCHGQQWLRLRRASRRPAAARRHVRPGLVFAAVFLVLGIPLAVRHPWLLLAAAACGPFVAVNTLYARVNRERALPNGLAAVVPAGPGCRGRPRLPACSTSGARSPTSRR
ncbi:YwiC-like family protein [Streptomyces sp. H27-H5]|uniref:YwiC-like family protein n=1 Tax=Streptomyces sp. H27-H5 TaxID=2996460 RepID=UPI0022703F2C|nr:YwiC-like family protein [Streptomyces sp. H27-H5]MCY0960217.1 YwiC-like family protein [Streptomyces sp. H27-H5]